MKIMEIRPDFNKSHTCHYCGKHMAEEGHEAIEIIYRIVKVYPVPIALNYISLKFFIPRCKTCDKRDNEILFLFPILFIIAEYLIFRMFWVNNYKPEGLWDWAWLIGLTLFLSFWITAIIYLIINFVKNLLAQKSKKMKHSWEYEPIDYLLQKGWQLTKPDPVAHMSTSREEGKSFNENEFKLDIHKITHDNNCLFIC